MGIQFLGFDFHIDFEALTLISQDLRNVLLAAIPVVGIVASVKIMADLAKTLLKRDNKIKTEGDKK